MSIAISRARAIRSRELASIRRVPAADAAPEDSSSSAERTAALAAPSEGRGDVRDLSPRLRGEQIAMSEFCLVRRRAMSNPLVRPRATPYSSPVWVLTNFARLLFAPILMQITDKKRFSAGKAQLDVARACSAGMPKKVS